MLEQDMGMPEFDVRYDEETGCVHASYRGRLDRDSMHRYAKEIVRVASEHACTRFLNDLRKARIGFSVLSEPSTYGGGPGEVLPTRSKV
jgi:hypothetical protein